jgi:hypothetical protein
MGAMHRVGEQHGLVVGQRVQDFFIVRDESLLLFLVELTRDNFRLVIFELCVPKIRFGVDAASGRRKLAS